MTLFSKFVSPLSDRSQGGNPGYYSNALGGDADVTKLRVGGADYAVLFTSSHELKVVLRPRAGPNDHFFVNLSDVEPDPGALHQQAICTDLPVLVDSAWSPKNGLADPTAGAPALSADDLTGARVDADLVSGLTSGAGKVALIKPVYFGVGPLGDLNLDDTYDIDNPEDKAQLLSTLPDDAKDWLNLMSAAYSDANAAQMIALLNNAASGDADLLASLVGERRGTVNRTPIDQVPPRWILVSSRAPHTLEYVHSLGRQVQAVPVKGAQGPSTINVVNMDSKAEELNAQTRQSAVKYGLLCASLQVEHGEVTNPKLGTTTQRLKQLQEMTGVAAKCTALREMWAASKGTKGPLSSFYFGDDMSESTAKNILTMNWNTKAMATADTSTDLGGFSIFDLSPRPPVVRQVVKALLAAEESANPAQARARASVGTDVERAAYFTKEPHIKRLCANVMRLISIVVILSEEDLSRFGENVKLVFDLADSDDYSVWLDKPSGGKKCPWATPQLAFFLEQYTCAVVATARSPFNYSAGGTGDISNVDFTGVLRAEKTLRKRVEKYMEAMENGSSVPLSLPAVMPEWLRTTSSDAPSPAAPAAAPAGSRPSRETGSPREGGILRGQSRPKKARFSDISINGGLSNRGDFGRRSSDSGSGQRFGSHVVIGNQTDTSVFPESLRPPNLQWEAWSIAGQVAGCAVPDEWRRTWANYSSSEKTALIEYVQANRSKVAFNADNRRVAETLRSMNLSDLLVTPGSAAHRG